MASQRNTEIVYASCILPRPIGGSRSGNRQVDVSEASNSGILEARNPETAWREIVMEGNRMASNEMACNGMEWNEWNFTLTSKLKLTESGPHGDVSGRAASRRVT